MAFKTRIIRTPSIHEGAINLLMSSIIEIERRRLNKILIEMNRRNKMVSGSKSDGFLFAGTFEYPSGISGTLPTLAQRVPLHKSLWEEMKDLQIERERIRDELKYVQMILVRIISECVTFQDIRDALPDFLICFYPPGKGLTRTREELWTITNDEQAMKQYKLLETKLALYAANRLIY